MESVDFPRLHTQTLEAVLLSEEGLSIPRIADVLWGYNSTEMSDSYVPRMISSIRTKIKNAIGINGKQLLKTIGNRYVWDHERLKGNVHYRNRNFRRNSRSQDGITIL